MSPAASPGSPPLAWFRSLDGGGLAPVALAFLWSRLAWDALKGKYPGLGEERAWDIVRREAEGGGGATRTPGEADVLRQVRALGRIEAEWRHARLDNKLLMGLHGALIGVEPDQIAWRQEELTLDAGFVTPVPPEAIEREMQAYWALLSEADTVRPEAELGAQLEMAVRLFALLIWIHPFPDANGRTARMMTNVFLRRMRLPYVPIPKVRNSEEWLLALQEALAGRPEAAVAHLEGWLLGTLGALREYLAGSGRQEVRPNA